MSWVILVIAQGWVGLWGEGYDAVWCWSWPTGSFFRTHGAEHGTVQEPRFQSSVPRISVNPLYLLFGWSPLSTNTIYILPRNPTNDHRSQNWSFYLSWMRGSGCWKQICDLRFEVAGLEDVGPLTQGRNLVGPKLVVPITGCVRNFVLFTLLLE